MAIGRIRAQVYGETGAWEAERDIEEVMARIPGLVGVWDGDEYKLPSPYSPHRLVVDGEVAWERVRTWRSEAVSGERVVVTGPDRWLPNFDSGTWHRGRHGEAWPTYAVTLPTLTMEFSGGVYEYSAELALARAEGPRWVENVWAEGSGAIPATLSVPGHGPRDGVLGLGFEKPDTLRITCGSRYHPDGLVTDKWPSSFTSAVVPKGTMPITLEGLVGAASWVDAGYEMVVPEVTFTYEGGADEGSMAFTVPGGTTWSQFTNSSANPGFSSVYPYVYSPFDHPVVDASGAYVAPSDYITAGAYQPG